MSPFFWLVWIIQSELFRAHNKPNVMPKTLTAKKPAKKPAAPKKAANPWLAAFKEIRSKAQTQVVINLLLTKQCNFSCGHCMFRAGPQQPKDYMSNDDLEAITSYANILKTAGFDVTLNLVGGEPSLNLEEFERCLIQIAYRLNPTINLEMTTNGWWLRSWAKTKRFMQALTNARIHEHIQIRISDSPFHDPFRKEERKIISLLRHNAEENIHSVFTHFWEQENPKESRALTCLHCYDQLPAGNIDKLKTCPSCDTEFDDSDRMEMHQTFENENSDNRGYHGIILASMLHRNKNTIYVDTQTPDQMVPVGRAADNQLGWKDGNCHWRDDIKFTFQPGGNLHDPCCNGGRVDLGHVSEGWGLFLKRIAYMRDLHTAFPNPDRKTSVGRCLECPAYGKKWTETQNIQRNAEIQRAVKSIISLLAKEE